MDGYGKDENASIIMILVKVGHFGAQGSVDKKLEDAFERLAIFCKNSRKHTSIVEFSKKQFKINKGATRLQRVFKVYTFDFDISYIYMI